MKIRSGFVSNSSSSSFVLDGSNTEVQELMKEVIPQLKYSISDLSRCTVVDQDVRSLLQFWRRDSIMEYDSEKFESVMLYNNIRLEDAIYVRISDEEDCDLFVDTDHSWYVYTNDDETDEELMEKVKQCRVAMQNRIKELNSEERKQKAKKDRWLIQYDEDEIARKEQSLAMTDQEVFDMVRRQHKLNKKFNELAIELGDYH